MSIRILLHCFLTAVICFLIGCAVSEIKPSLKLDDTERIIEKVVILPTEIKERTGLRKTTVLPFYRPFTFNEYEKVRRPDLSVKGNDSDRLREKFDRSLRDKILDSGLAEYVMLQGASETPHPPTSRLGLRLKAEPNLIEKVGHTPNFGRLIGGSICTLGLGVPLLFFLETADYKGDSEASIELIDMETNTSLFQEYLKVSSTTSGSNYNTYGKLRKLDNTLHNNVLVLAIKKIEDRLKNNLKLKQRVVELSKANYSKRPTAVSSPAVPLSQPIISRKGPSPSIQKNTYAVIIGISRYKHSDGDLLTNLPFADDDARAFQNILLKKGWSEHHMKVLINEKATMRNILIALESWLTKAGPDDLIVFYWSGHGFPDPEDPEKVYFACHDTDINIPATGYRMDRVRQILKERDAKNVVILADTCHAGKLITRGKRGLTMRPYLNKLAKTDKIPKGWIFMVGADTDRQAIEHSSWTNGAFTHSLIKGLSGEADGFQSMGPTDKVVTMRELRAYMSTKMPDETLKVLGVAKRPVITTSSGDPEIWNLTLQKR